MQYYDLSTKKHHFLVTPDELRMILEKFHHVVVNTGVRKDYVESDPNEFFCKYDSLYNRLKNGEQLVWKDDYDIVSFTTGITLHLENCLYQPSSKRSVPHFLEPCPWIDTFCFVQWKEQLSTSFAVFQFPQNICGLCLHFPSKIEYPTDTTKHPKGIVFNTDLDDFRTYEELLSRIKSITKPLKLAIDGKIHRTAVRISENAKKDFCGFNFVKENSIEII